jgi:hypothetical protein
MRTGAILQEVLRQGFFASDDEDGRGRESLMRRPDDSQYELSAVFDDDASDSQVDRSAFATENAHSDDAHAMANLEPAGADARHAVPWYYNYIDSWGRFHFIAALGFAAASLSVLGFLLVRALVAGEVMHTSITALIVGCLGTIAFLLLSMTAAALVVLLADLGKTIRDSSLHANRSFPGGGGARAARNRPNLSRSVG